VPTDSDVSVPWQDLDSRRASFIDATCIPSGLTTLKPSSMPLQDIYVLYSHIIDIQDSNHAFEFKEDCKSVQSLSTPVQAISGLTLEQQDTPTQGSQDDNVLDNAVNTDSRKPEDDSEKAPDTILDVSGGDVEVTYEAGSNIKCVY
jgi:hypothetical protein